MKKQNGLFFAFIILFAFGKAQGPFEKYGPFQTKNYLSFFEALKEKDLAFKLQSENENLHKEIRKIDELWHLQVLILKKNELDSLPKQVGKLNNLLYFASIQNPLQKLPPEIMYWNQLNEMLLVNCIFDSLPEEMAGLQALKILEIQSNEADTFKLGSGCKKLANLKSLILYNNNLYSFPKEILACNQLNEVVITSCKIKNIPSEIKSLNNLQTLVLDSNQIEKIPAELFEMQSLKYISLKNNNLTFLPENFSHLINLEQLDLSGNKIPEDRVAILRVLMPKCKITF